MATIDDAIRIRWPCRTVEEVRAAVRIAEEILNADDEYADRIRKHIIDRAGALGSLVPAACIPASWNRSSGSALWLGECAGPLTGLRPDAWANLERVH